MSTRGAVSVTAGQNNPNRSRSLECPFQTDTYISAGGETGLSTAILQTLPTIIHEKSSAHAVCEVSEDIEGFIKAELDVSRLNAIHSHLWACGRPLNARALHRQRLMNRQVVITEQADLHLLYHSDVLFVKPLPAYLLSRVVWSLYLNKEEKVHRDACGLLLSYIWLIRSPVDFKIAEKENLLPAELTWLQWKAIVHEVVGAINVNSLHQVNKRYHFGELRLHRVNSVYRVRFLFTHFVRGYLYGYNRYKAFFQRSVGWVLVVFVWFSLVLSAMQVGVSIPRLQDKIGFNDASFGFVIFSMVAVAVLVVFVSVLFSIVFLYNMVAAIRHAKKEARRRKKLADEWETQKKVV